MYALALPRLGAHFRATQPARHSAPSEADSRQRRPPVFVPQPSVPLTGPDSSCYCYFVALFISFGVIDPLASPNSLLVFYSLNYHDQSMRYDILHYRSNYGTPDQGLTLGRLWYPTSHGLDNDVDLGSLLVYVQGAAVFRSAQSQTARASGECANLSEYTWLVQRIDPQADSGRASASLRLVCRSLL